MAKRKNMRNKRNDWKSDSHKSYRKREDARDYDNRKPEGRTGSNDISWYTKNPTLLVAAGQFPYPYRPGMNVPFGTQTAYDKRTGAVSTIGGGKYYVPGIVTIHWAPTFGHSSSATDPGSIAGKEIYAKVRKVYSGSLDADAPDFMLYLACLDSVYSYLAWLKRMYRVINVWTPENYMLPDGLLRSMGCTSGVISVLRDNLTQFWQVINELILMSRKFTCPALMDVMNRHYWMSDNVYADDASLNSQFFMFNPEGFYRYKEQDDPNGTGIKVPGAEFVPLYKPLFYSGTKAVSVERFYEFGRSLIDALVAWDDAYTINGYLARAYEGVPQFIVDELPQVSEFTPVYNPEVLTQIENVQTLPMCFGDFLWVSEPSASTNAWLTLSQNPQTNAFLSLKDFTVKFDSTVSGSADVSVEDKRGELASGTVTLNPYISSRAQSPQVADNVIATRLKSTVQLTPTTTAGIFSCHIICGTEVVTRLSTNAASEPLGTDIPMEWFLGSASAADLMRQSLFCMSAADWHPMIRVTEIVTPSSSPKWQRIMFLGDIHNLTEISKSDLENLHKVCTYSELNAFMV